MLLNHLTRINETSIRGMLNEMSESSDIVLKLDAEAIAIGESSQTSDSAIVGLN